MAGQNATVHKHATKSSVPATATEKLTLGSGVQHEQSLGEKHCSADLLSEVV